MDNTTEDTINLESDRQEELEQDRAITYTVTKGVFAEMPRYYTNLYIHRARFMITGNGETITINTRACYAKWKKKVKALGHTVKEEWSK